MIGTKKKAAAAIRAYVDNISGEDYQPPEPGEMRAKLDPHIRRYADALPMREKKAAWLRPAIIGIVVILAISVVSIKPVRAGILGILADFYMALSGGEKKTVYTLDMPDALLLSSDTRDDYSISFYSVAGTQVTLITESDKDSGRAWVDRHGEPFTIYDLQIEPHEALCYEDELGLYAEIDGENAKLLITMEGGDRELFTDVLRAIRGSK